MQRRWYLAVLLAASLVPVATYAQRGFGGGRVSMGSPSRGPASGPRSMGSFGPSGRSFAGSMGGSRVFVPHRTFVPNRIFVPNHSFVPVRTFVPRGGIRVDAGFGFRRFHRFRDFDDFRFRRPFFFGGGCFNRFNPFCNQFFFGSSFGFGGFGYAPYYPSYPVDYSAYQAPPQQVVVESDNSRELSREVESLSNEVQLLRDEDLRRYNESRAAILQNQGSLSAQQPPDYTVLVFRDGHKQSIQNYAVAGDTLWIITEQSAKKIPLSDLDIPATQQANSVNGVEFRVPSAPPNR